MVIGLARYIIDYWINKLSQNGNLIFFLMSISFQKLPIRIGVELLINEGTLSFDRNSTTCSSIFG